MNTSTKYLLASGQGCFLATTHKTTSGAAYDAIIATTKELLPFFLKKRC